MVTDFLIIIAWFGGFWLAWALLFIEIPYLIAMRRLRNIPHSGSPLPIEPSEERR